MIILGYNIKPLGLINVPYILPWVLSLESVLYIFHKIEFAKIPLNILARIIVALRD